MGLPSEDFSDLVREVKRPTHFQYEPNHFQRTQNIKEGTKGGTSKPKPAEFNVTKPCFGLDFEREEIGIDEVARGYKVGGPKEARLFRVALLAAKKDTDHLFPVKVSGVHSMIKDGDLRDILRGSDPLWSVHVVDIYMCPRTGLISHALEISYCSTSCAVGREAADKIRKEVELQLPHHLNMARREHVVDAGKEREHAEEGEWYTLRREKIGGRVSQPYFWQVAQVKAGMTNTSHGQLSVALSEVEKQGQAEPTLWLLSDDNLGKSGSCGGGDPDVELIRAMARKLWRRRLGVLIRDVDLSSGVDLPEEDEGGLISSIRRVEEVEAEAEASDGEFLRETDDEMEVKTSSAEQDSTTGQYSLYLLEHSHSGRTYAGVTVDLSRRIQQHNGVLKGGAKYTAAFRGQSGLWEYAVCLEGLSHSRALRLEAAIKKESRRLPPAKEVGVSRAKQRADLILSLVEDSERKRIRVMNL